ncbi:MAG TPA: nicotinate-nicotinamide nucleotide adenylyltransferase [Polyangia bacterium]|nr:nicotinate-nicotinamide nucleotide adenylyltransferase [Polyangia bacterium]
MRIGIIGGTFDPPHVGHLGAVAAALASGQIDRVLLAPCLGHAFGKAPVPFAHRLAMCRLLVAGEPRAEVSDAELEIATPGRTLELLRVLGERHPGAALRLVAGADIYFERDKWYRFDEVARLAPPLYVGRRGVSPLPEPTLPAPPEVDSTGLRARLAAGGRPADLVPVAVLDYIAAHGLYGAGT